MAKPAARPPSSPSSHLTLGVVLLVALVAAVAAGAVAAWAEWRIRSTASTARVAGADELDAAVRAQTWADGQRLEELALVAARLARRADLPMGGDGAADPEGGTSRLRTLIAALEDVLDENQVELIVLRGSGEMALRVGAPADAARELAVSELMGRVLEEGAASGVWSFGGGLYRVAAERVIQGEEGPTVGAIAVADRVSRATAIQVRGASRAETVYLMRDPGAGGSAAIVASTLDQDAGARVVEALAGAGALDEALRAEAGRVPVDVRVGRTAFRAVAVPLDPGAGGAAAARVALVETGTEARRLRMAQAAALAGGLAALLLGVLGAPLVTRGAGVQGKEVVEAARAARAGDLAGAARHAVPEALALYFQGAAEKRALEGAVAAFDRSGGGEAEDDAGVERRQGAVLLIDMPRYARVPKDQDPREAIERLGRDLVRLRRAASSRDGKVEGAFGHRALAVFAGERAAERALGAAAEVMAALSAPESAFDEPVPPVLSLATGTLLLGGPEGGRAVAGLPVQQAESLLREASSGELIVADRAFGALGPGLEAEGVALSGQRGLLTPRPVYLLDAATTARAAAALGTDGGSRSTGALRLSTGEVLDDRFVLVERRTATPAWTVYGARDRETEALVTVRALHPETILDDGPFEMEDGPLRGVQRASGPGVERLLGVGVERGVPYLASERSEGIRLSTLAGRLLRDRRPFGVAASLRVARCAADALATVHRAGAAHGALRPAALVIDRGGTGRLTELGLAPALPVPGVDPAVDRALGPPRYQAPERLAGGEATAAADVYALGAVLVELFTGRPFYGGDEADESLDRLRDRLAAGPPELPDATELPDGLAEILARCLAHDPEARYPDGAALAEALEPVRAEIVSRA